MIGFYNYTVILTYIGTAFGFVGIVFVWQGSLKFALTCLMIAGLCDMFDGRVAATRMRTRSEKRFGVQIDSLSDLICFGVLPASIIFNVVDGTVFKYLISAVFLLCALIRLAWFNVDEELRQDSETEKRKFYKGLPVTSCALVFPLLIGICDMANVLTNKIICVPFLLVAFAFLAPFRLRKAETGGSLMMIIMGIIALVVMMMEVK